MAAKKKKNKSSDTEEKKDDQKKQEEKETPRDEKYSELEKKVGEMSKYINDTNEFIQGASVVINTLAYNPELKEAFQSQLKKQYGMVGEGQESGQQQKQSQAQTNNTQQVKGQNDDVGKKVDEVVTSQREQIIQSFEKDHGISGMKDDDRKEARRKLEEYLNDFGVSVKNSPLPNLRNNLEKAYFGTIGMDKLKEEGKLEGIVSARTNEKGVMGTISSGGAGESSDSEELTDGQKAWAKKLGVDPDKAKKRFLTQDKEATRQSKSEKKAKK